MSGPQLSELKYQTSVAQKLLSREAARKFRNGSQRIHILREKCRQRIQQARLTRFDGARNIEKDDENLINKILEEEVDSNLTLENEVFNELRNEMCQWLLEQQDEENDYLSQLDENDVVCCPMCLKSSLNKCDSQIIQCQCGVRFKYNGKLADFNSEIRDVIDKHEQLCDQALLFFIEQHTCALNIICETCNYFHNFV